ncbi:MAG: glycosyltransferase family 39 protein [Gemmataceae bacterium]
MRTWAWLVPVLLTLGVGAWKVTHTRCLTEDSVVFLRFARQLGGAVPPAIEPLRSRAAPSPRLLPDALVTSSPLLSVMERYDQHPGYPLLVCAAERCLGRWLGDEPAARWGRAGQLVSLAAGVVLTLAAFRLGRQLGGRAAGAAAAFVVAASPALADHRADVLSDPAALALLVLSASQAVDLLRRRTFRAAAGCGLFGALGYLCRPEAVQITLLAGLWLLSAVVTGPGRGRTAVLGVFLLVPVLALAGPYVLLRGGPFTKSTRLLVEREVDGRLTHRPSARVAPALTGAVVAARGVHEFLRGWWRDLGGAAVALIAVGLWAARRRISDDPAARLIALALALNALLLVGALYRTKGYLDGRHVLPFALLSACWAWAGAVAVARRLAPALVLVAVLPNVPSLVGPLHPERAGLYAASEWLRGHVRAGEEVVDPSGLAAFHGGLDDRNGWLPWFAEPAAADLRRCCRHSPRVAYVVCHTRTASERQVRDAFGGDARPVFRTPAGSDAGCRFDIIIYRVGEAAP